jgi:hypothetical protein
MGRPPGRIQDRLFQMRLSEEFLERLDEWRGKQPDLPSRAEAIRRDAIFVSNTGGESALGLEPS